MELITENRTRMLQVVEEIDARKIISFGMFDIEKLRNKPLMIIVNKTQFANYKKRIPDNWIVRTNNKIHAKLAIGLKGFIIGSWNFTDNSTNTMHESIMKVDYYEAPILQRNLADYFERLWERSTAVKK